MLRVVDPREQELPAAGLTALRDAESGRSLLVDTRSRRLRQRYAAAADRRSRAFARWCANSGAQGFTLRTDVDPLRGLMELFRSRTVQRSRR